MPHLLKKRLAVVTGGSRGIGAAISAELAARGARVIAIGKNPRSEVPKGCVSYKAVNFENVDNIQVLADEIKRWGVDILINNAGINKIGPFDEVDPKDFERIMNVNLRAPFFLCRAVIPGMKKRKWGRIVNISSIFGKISREFRSPYSASKFALDGMTVSLAAEVAPYGILANCVAPGFVDTDLTRTILGKSGMRAVVKSVPIQRLCKPREIAVFVAWLAGPENTFITGQNIAIDGGFSRI